MAFVGKPNRACRMCKSRKVKCDTQRPACGQCTKSGRECPGYLDEYSLIFRDESKAVAKNAEKKRSKAVRAEAPRSRILSKSPLPISSGNTPSPGVIDFNAGNGLSLTSSHSTNGTTSQVIQLSPQHGVPICLSESIENLATAFYIRNIILPACHPSSVQTFIRYTIPMYNETSINSTLHKAIGAVALGIFSLYPERYQLQPQSRRLYTQALKDIRDDINDPVRVKLDQTLVSVLMLASYENLLSTSSSAEAFKSHIDGAVSIVKIKGQEQFYSQRSLTLFRSVRNIMITTSLRNGRPLKNIPDPAGLEIADDMENLPSNRLTVITMALPNTLVECKRLFTLPKTPSTHGQILGLIRSLQKIDAELVAWNTKLPGWQTPKIYFVISKLPDDIFSAEFWRGPVHSYRDVFVANVALDYCIARIMCQKALLQASQYLAQNGEDVAQLSVVQVATYVIQDMVDRICYSVPFHVSQIFQDQTKDEDDRSAARGFGAYLLVWPLQAALSCETIPELQRNWIRGRLLYIKEEFGLRRAEGSVPRT